MTMRYGIPGFGPVFETQGVFERTDQGDQTCDRKYAVNADNHDEEQALLDAKGPCGSVRDTRPVRELRCTFGTCNVILGDYGNQM